nr:hypothetical protein [Tanacetum cinerariifolium]
MKTIGVNVRNQNRHMQKNRNQTLGNLIGDVATLVVGNYGNGHNENQIMCYNCKGLGHLLRDFTNKPTKRDLIDEEEKEQQINANYIHMENMQEATSDSKTDTHHVYDIDALCEVPNFDNHYDNYMFNMPPHEHQHLKIPESFQDTYVEQQNDNNIVTETPDMDFSGGDI